MSGEGDCAGSAASPRPGGRELLEVGTEHVSQKGLYPDILALVEARLRPGAWVLADNADWSPEYLERVRSPRHGYLSVPFASEVELSMRLG